MQEADSKLRDINVQRSRLEAQARADRMAIIYDVAPVQKAQRQEALALEHAVNEQVLQKMALAALHHCVMTREKKNEDKREREETRLARITRAETDRLQEILSTDRKARLRQEEKDAKAKEKMLRDKKLKKKVIQHD